MMTSALRTLAQCPDLAEQTMVTMGRTGSVDGASMLLLLYTRDSPGAVSALARGEGEIIVPLTIAMVRVRVLALALALGALRLRKRAAGPASVLLALVIAVASAASPHAVVDASFDPSVSYLAVDALVSPAVGALPTAEQVTFGAGSLIIPMDIRYQDPGMLKAFGLVDRLLRAGVPVNWSIAPTKTLYTDTSSSPPASSIDFTASATDVASGDTIGSHGYRGGPFVVDAAYAGQALAVARDWIVAHPRTAVHQSTADFAAPVARILVEAPSIAVLDTGNQHIIFEYLNAAGIPDGSGGLWSAASPGLLTPAAVAGPTLGLRDGALFDATGQPIYSQLAAATWGAPRDAITAEVVAELASFLTHRTHVFASGSAAIVIEGSSAGHFLTTDNGKGEPSATDMLCTATSANGLCVASSLPRTVSFAHADLVFAQVDGQFGTIGGSVRAFALAGGSTYLDPGVVITRDGSATSDGIADIWLTGYAKGVCRMALSATESSECVGAGKVSYLGGHQYDVAMPISVNPTTQGARLFLQSLLEAGSIGAHALEAHDIGVAGGGFRTDGRVPSGASGVPVKIKLKNFGDVAEEVAFFVASSVTTDTFSDACSSTRTLGPGDTALVSGCTVSYSGSASGERTLTLRVKHADVSHGAADRALSNNTKSQRVLVLP